jgi:hypothetical protein
MMKQKKLFVTGILCVALVFGFVLTGCGGDDGLSIPSITAFGTSDLPAGVEFEEDAKNVLAKDINPVAKMIVPYLARTFVLVRDEIFEMAFYRANGSFSFNASALPSYLSYNGISDLRGRITGSVDINQSRGSGSEDFSTNDLSYSVYKSSYYSFIEGKVKAAIEFQLSGNSDAATEEQAGAFSAAVAFQIGDYDEEEGDYIFYGGRALITTSISYVYRETRNGGSYTSGPEATINIKLYEMTSTTLITEKTYSGYDALDLLGFYD